MHTFLEQTPEGKQDRRRLSVDSLLKIEKLTGKPTQILRLFARWRDHSDLNGFSWIDVKPDNPLDFVLHNHLGTFVGDLSNRSLKTYPFRMHARSCAAEYLDCKIEAQPTAHYVSQELAGKTREYVRLMIPIIGVGGVVSEIVYAYRHIKPL